MKKKTTNKTDTGWDKLTLAEFYEVQDAVYDIDDPIEQQLTLISIVNHIPKEDLLSYPLSQLRELNHTIAFLNHSPSPAPLQYDYNVNGTTYCFSPNLTDLTVAQYVDYQNYLKEIEKEKKEQQTSERKKLDEVNANNSAEPKDESEDVKNSTSELLDTQTQNPEGEANTKSDFLNIPFRLSRKFPQVLSVFLIPKNHKYGEGYDMQKCASDVLLLPVTKLLQISSFFFTLYLSCENAMISLAKEELRKSKKANF